MRSNLRSRAVGSRVAGAAMSDGAWFVYGWDMNAYPLGLFGSEIDALRFAQGLGYHSNVKFWEWGEWER